MSISASHRPAFLPSTALVLAFALGACSPWDQPSDRFSVAAGPDGELLHRVLMVQDQRTLGDYHLDRASLEVFQRGLGSANPRVRQLTARAVGRFEDPGLLDLLSPALSDPNAGVRADAANGIAQLYHQGGDPTSAAALLKLQWLRETRPNVRAALARSLGRLPYSHEEDVQAVESILIGAAVQGVRDPRAVRGVVRGVADLGLTRRRLGLDVPNAVLGRLGAVAFDDEPRPLAANPTDPTPEDWVRRAAMDGLSRLGGVTEQVAEFAAADPDPEVRRLGARGVGTLPAPRAARVIEPYLEDVDGAVRFEALGAYARAARSEGGCGPILAGLTDEWPHTPLLALDLLGAPCEAPLQDVALDALLDRAGRLGEGRWPLAAWHEPAHALVSLARIAPDRAVPLAGAAALGEPWQVRMYAAQAARVLRDEGVLRLLATDTDANVATAAIQGLMEVAGHGADPLYRAALGSPDAQLVMTAAGALAGTPQPAEALFDLVVALDRFSARDEETSRDARVAILARLGELGGVDQAASLEPLFRDSDPMVAQTAAELVSRWLDQEFTAHPEALPRTPVPSQGTLARFSMAHVILTMEDGGEVILSLAPYAAPTNVGRLVRLAEDGILDGLTLHRIAPNFVVQGLSPGANEYWGHGDFSRDEVGLASNVRTTVGLSTRGHDTGDGQIYFNTVDNYRLDHTYTVLARVVEGMDVVDRMLEGARVERAVVRYADETGN